MKKRNALLCTILALFFVLYSTLGISGRKDPLLETAVEITQKLFLSNSKGEKKDYISARYLKGLDETDSFVIAECDKGGYAIYDKESLEIIEYSDTDYSPFSSISQSNSYYAGPASYYEKSASEFQSLVNNEKISKEDGIKIASSFKETFKTNQLARAEKYSTTKKEQELTKSGSIDTTASGSLDTATSKSIDTNSTRASIGEYGDPSIYTFSSKKYIDKYYFFVNNTFHGENTDDTCTAVAVQLLLAYNHWTNDGRLIPYQPDENTQFLLYEPTDEIKAKFDNHSYSATTSDTTSAKTSFYGYLKTIIPAASTLSRALVGIRTYISNYAPEVEYNIYASPIVGKNMYQSVKQEINSNRPTLVLINLPNTIKWHSVVVHGYQEIIVNNQTINGLLAHFGWKYKNGISVPSNVWFSSSLMLSYLTFQTTHIHSDDVFIYEGQTTIDYHIVKCSTCGRVAHNNLHTIQTHTMQPGSLNHSKYHISRCACGYTIEMRHNFEYTPTIDNDNISKHKKSCSLCGYTEINDHFYKNPNECYYCLAPCV